MIERQRGRFRCGRFPTGRWHRGLALMWVAAALAIGHLPANAASLYEVAKLSVDVRAKNAVEAKKRALIVAERQAARIVFKRLAPFNYSDRLPQVQTSLIEDMLEGFSVRRERNSGTRYLATLDFSFRKQIVDRLLAGYGIPISDQQATPVALLPVYIANGKLDTSGRDPWRKAWRGLDLANAVTPLTLKSVSGKVTRKMVDAILQGNSVVYAELLALYKVHRLVLAVAAPNGQGKLETKLVGADRVGSIAVRRQDSFAPKKLRAAADRAAAVALGIIEGRWKVSRAEDWQGGVSWTPEDVALVVRFSGLRQWQAIRARLARVPGVQGLKIGAISARSARVALSYPGGAEGLASALGQHGLDLQNRGGNWILQSF